MGNIGLNLSENVQINDNPAIIVIPIIIIILLYVFILDAGGSSNASGTYTSMNGNTSNVTLYDNSDLFQSDLMIENIVANQSGGGNGSLTASVTPEPSSIIMALLGILGVSFFELRRRLCLKTVCMCVQ
jgi:hypothetical protein